MNILGPDELLFGVDDIDSCAQYLIDYGLEPLDISERGGRFEALDGTAIVLRRSDDASLPADLGTQNMLRETVYGVADAATVSAIREELSRDRAAHVDENGVLHSTDDMGFAIGFQATCRRTLQMAAEQVNAPGAAQRGVNQIAVRSDIEARPRTLSHVVYFVPDAAKAEAFYIKRLGFTCTDRFAEVGPFLRPAGTVDHHTLFMIQTPAFMKGCEHFTFHLGGPTELMVAGTRFVEKGYQSFWGPGRHRFGSNWFWYFNSPLGCHVEYDADMDLHDDTWTPREVSLSADASQLFLFSRQEKWAPGGPSPDGQSGH